MRRGQLCGWARRVRFERHTRRQQKACEIRARNQSAAFSAGFFQHILYMQLLVALTALALQAGEQAPEFGLQDHSGKTVKLSDYAGKKVVLWFYPRASTGG